MRRRLPLILAVLLVGALLGWPAGNTLAAARSGAPGWPLSGRVAVLTEFSPPRVRWRAGHLGVDLSGAAGQPVLATRAGRVSVSGRVAGRGVVVVRHSDGSRTTVEPVAALVAVGQRVRVGDVLGRLQPGHCGGRVCLHWGLRSAAGEYLDPRPAGGAGVRLLPAEAVDQASQRAAERASAARVAGVTVGGLATAAEPGGHGFLRPVAGAVTSPFGMRLHPITRVWKLHDGTDFGAACGTPVRAAFGGRAVAVIDTAYGKRVLLNHGKVDDRAVRTGYNHLSRFAVDTGARVRRGQVVGYVGSTGLSTGCHVHLMVWLDGRIANPMAWLG